MGNALGAGELENVGPAYNGLMAGWPNMKSLGGVLESVTVALVVEICFSEISRMLPERLRGREGLEAGLLRWTKNEGE
jgi:hypothetical protein